MISPRTPPPTGWQMLRHLGPGLIIAAVIVGSGELIVTPKLGATVGFTLLWFIVLGCVLKVFVQVELGRYAICRGRTTLEAMNTVPGPRWVVSWLVWLWVFMYLALVFQVAGMVGGLVEILELSGLQWRRCVLALGTVLVCVGLLIAGRYRLVERVSTLLVEARHQPRSGCRHRPGARGAFRGDRASVLKGPWKLWGSFVTERRTR